MTNSGGDQGGDWNEINNMMAHCGSVNGVFQVASLDQF